MAENKIASVPVASHGLHKHSYNYPWLSSINFGDVMPCYYNTIRKGEKDNPKAGLYSQLMPIVHNAFVTGRYNFKAIFVPYKLVWRPWYSFAESTEFNSDGVQSLPNRYPFVSQEKLNASFYTLCTGAGSVNDYDIIWRDGNNNEYRYVNGDGRNVLKILMALGSTPSFIVGDKNTINILPILCYIKAFADYYFPNQYVGNGQYNLLAKFFDRDIIDFSNYTDDLLNALMVCSCAYYDNSIFDNAWDNPATPNVLNMVPAVKVQDISNDAQTGHLVISNQNGGDGVSPQGAGYKPTNNTPFVGSSIANASGALGVFTQYVIDSLRAISMWAKRHQFSGARLLDRFLVSRGVPVSNDSARMSFFMGQRNVEIQVNGVENNSNTNLGELAGRGIASSGEEPISFKLRAEDDGIFIVIVSAIPDANFPILLDGFVTRKDYMDTYHAEFDKLGAAAVPSRVVCQGFNGQYNDLHRDGVFGFLNQYWDEVQERPRLLGDFVLHSKGSDELAAYHTFRSVLSTIGAHHGYDFVRMEDKSQYQRLFYSETQENLMLFLRWYGEQYKEKLPLGDSYEWDDDEMNRRVNIVVNGSQK